MAATGGAIRAGRAFVELFADNSRLTAGLKVAQLKFRSAVSYMQRLSLGIGGEVGRMFAAFLPAGILAGLTAATKLFAKLGDEIDKARSRTGIEAEQLSALGYAAEQSGSDLNALVDGVIKMQRFLVDAAHSSPPAVEALGELGLTMADLASLTPDQQFVRISEALANIRNPALRADVALTIFGRGAQSLLPLINSGARGINELAQEADRLGLVVSGIDATNAAALGDAFSRLWRASGAVAFKISAALAPALTKALDAMANAAASVGRWVKAHQGIIRVAAIVVAGVSALAAGFVALGVSLVVLQTLAGAIAAAFLAVGSVLGGLVSIVAALVTSPLGLFLTAVATALSVLATWAIRSGVAMDWLAESFSPLGKFAIEVFSAIKQALLEGDWAAAANVLWSALRLAWVNGTKGIWDVFLGFKANFLKGWVDFQLLLTKGWMETVRFIQDAWSLGVGKIAEWTFRLQGRPDLAEEVKNNTTADIGEREKKHRDVVREVEEQAKRDQQGVDQQLDQDIAGSEANLIAARKAYEAAIRDAKKLPKLPDSLRRALPDLSAAALQVESGQHGGGTFSAVAPRMFASQNPMAERLDRALGLLASMDTGIQDINRMT